MSRPQRTFRPHEHNRGPAINDRIRAKEVLLIDEHNNKVGVVPTIEALRRSHEAGLDLVEVSSESTPPVCRILDFGKYKYEQAKKDKMSKSKSKMAEMKEVRLGRSMKIDPHDVGIRVDQAHRFLLEGHKVQIVQNFRGRELQHKHLGDARMKAIIARLSDVSRVETPPRLNGRRMAMILAPDRPKIDALNRRGGGVPAAAAGTKAIEAESATTDEAVSATAPATAPPSVSPPANEAMAATRKDGKVGKTRSKPRASSAKTAAAPSAR